MSSFASWLFLSASFLSLLVLSPDALLSLLQVPALGLSGFRLEIVLFCGGFGGFVLFLMYSGMFDHNFLSFRPHFSGVCSSVDTICFSFCLTVSLYKSYSIFFFMTYRVYGLNFPR